MNDLDKDIKLFLVLLAYLIIGGLILGVLV